MNSQVYSTTIQSMRFPLILGVIALHCWLPTEGWHVSSIPSDSVTLDVVNAMMWLIGSAMSNPSVNAFFCLSGYLVMRGLQPWSHAVWLGKLQRRVHTLLIPYLLWILLYYFLQYLTHRLDNPSLLASLWVTKASKADNIDLLGHLHTPFGFPLLVPMWYVRDLLCALLFTPLLAWFFRPSRWQAHAALVVLAALWIALPSYPGVNLRALFFFGFGVYLQSQGRSFTPLSLHLTLCLALVSLAAFFVSQLCGNYLTIMLTYKIWEFAGMLMLFTLADWCHTHAPRAAHLLACLAPATFFVYASHPFVLPVVNAAAYRLTLLGGYHPASVLFASQYPVACFVLYLFRIALTTVLCLAAYTAVARFAPCLSRLLGGR